MWQYVAIIERATRSGGYVPDMVKEGLQIMIFIVLGPHQDIR